jgi:shikimate kinase
MNIYLIGYRCCGKTSVGKKLSQLSGKPFIDTDELIVQRAGLPIKDMVSLKGWDAFRELEKKVLEETVLIDNHIIATGGGIILNPDNIRNMKKAGCVIWLKAEPATIRTRMTKDIRTEDQRPGLTASGSLDEIEPVLSERTPLYASAADMILDADRIEVDGICGQIINLLHKD